MRPEELRERLAARLSLLTRCSYLLATATNLVRNAKASDLAKHLQDNVAHLCRTPKQLADDSIEMTPEQVADVREELPSFLADSLIVQLDALLHGFLQPDPNEADKSFEELLASLWPKDERRSDSWAYSETILLAEVRNAIVHGSGKLDIALSSARLVAAGVDLALLENDPVCENRAFDDFLRFKRAVRTVANGSLPRLAVTG